MVSAVVDQHEEHEEPVAKKVCRHDDGGVVTEEMMESVPKYMRGRLNAHKCNEALAEARRIAEINKRDPRTRMQDLLELEEAAN